MRRSTGRIAAHALGHGLRFAMLLRRRSSLPGSLLAEAARVSLSVFLRPVCASMVAAVFIRAY